jgi:RimJ/RimL family protein N-acetyltransferase
MAIDLGLPIVGARLTIRAATEQDLEDWYVLETDPDVKRYVGGQVTRSRDEWLAGMRGWIQRREMLHAVVAVNSSGAFAGRALLSRNDPNSKERELQVLIAKAYWGERFGREASELLIRAGFKRRFPAILAVVHPENAASLALVGALGFRNAGRKSSAEWDNGHLIFRLERPATRRSLRAR